MRGLVNKIKRGFFQNERGQGLVEFVLVFPVLLVFLSGVADTGWLIYNYTSLFDLTDTAVHANSKSDPGDAEEYMKLYIRNSFPEFDIDSMSISSTTQVKTYEYFEYIWKFNEKKHWKVPMYCKTLKTGLTITYEVDYLTPMGKIIFMDTDNSMEMTSHSMAVKVLENESYKLEEDEEDDAD